MAGLLDIPPLIAQETEGVQIAGFNLNPYLPLIQAVVILVVGFIVAWIVSAIVRSILNRTNFDNRLATWIAGEGTSPPVEKWISSIVFWLIMLFVLVAFFQALRLDAVSQPLNTLLDEVFSYLPRLAGAAILVAIAWILATIVKLVTTRGLRALHIDERLASSEHTPDATGTGFSLSETLGNVLYWFVFLFFLPSILSTLDLEGPLQPVENLLDQFLGILPEIFAAIIIAVAGWFVARIVRGIVTNLLAASQIDRLGYRLGIGDEVGEMRLSGLIGTVVYVLILIPVAISALDTLSIESVSEPAIDMLNQVLEAVPKIATAILILALAFYVGKFLSNLVSSLLSSIGFDNLLTWLGLQSQADRMPAPPSPTDPYISDPAAPPAGDFPPSATQQTPSNPSDIVGIIVWVGVMLFAAVAAINILEIPALTLLISGIVVISGRILAGLIVFGVGLYLANLAFSLITRGGGRQARILGQTARIAIITLISAMALQQMGVATDIVNLAFGLLVGAIAVAIALSFGLGGRDVAAEQLREWLNSFKRNY
ncbi:MAG: mechanosensitive ion channel [Thainema sp.]